MQIDGTQLRGGLNIAVENTSGKITACLSIRNLFVEWFVHILSHNIVRETERGSKNFILLPSQNISSPEVNELIIVWGHKKMKHIGLGRFQDKTIEKQTSQMLINLVSLRPW